MYQDALQLRRMNNNYIPKLLNKIIRLPDKSRGNLRSYLESNFSVLIHRITKINKPYPAKNKQISLIV